MHARSLSYAETGRFSPIVIDQLARDPFLDLFQAFPPSLEGLQQAAAARRFPAEHRAVLVKALRRQYEGIAIQGPVADNLERLARADALTVTTGHQLCLFTGPLYLPFKLLNAIRLAATLTKELGRPVIPVFWMASEDHDRAEVDHAWIGGRKITWPGKPAGAVGRMPLSGIDAVLDELDPLLGNGAHATDLRAELRACYRSGATLAEATRRFVHALLGRFGLLVIDGDDRELKKLFVPVMREELLNGIVQRTVSYANERLEERYSTQAHARPINLFHVRPGHRSRIERGEQGYHVLDGGPRASQDELLLDLELRPQDYSPNVLLRPLYQETVLPNIAYIGGGAEVAYWMQLKWLFHAVQVPMPVVVLRTSAAFLSGKDDEQRMELGLEIADLFRPEHELRNIVAHHVPGVRTDVAEEQQEMDVLFARLRARASAVDPTLGASTEAAAARARRLLGNLKGKMERALRKREGVRLRRSQALLDRLFPAGSLQERRDNILPMLAVRGPALLDDLLQALDPLQGRFTVLVGD